MLCSIIVNADGLRRAASYVSRVVRDGLSLGAHMEAGIAKLIVNESCKSIRNWIVMFV